MGPGSGRVVSSRVEPNRAETSQGKARQNQTKPNQTKPNQTKPNQSKGRARQVKASRVVSRHLVVVLLSPAGVTFGVTFFVAATLLRLEQLRRELCSLLPRNLPNRRSQAMGVEAGHAVRWEDCGSVHGSVPRARVARCVARRVARHERAARHAGERRAWCVGRRDGQTREGRRRALRPRAALTASYLRLLAASQAERFSGGLF